MPTWLGLIVTVFSIAAIGGAAIAVLRSNMAKTTTELWKGEAEAAAKKADRLEQEHKSCQEQLDILRMEFNSLREIVTGALSRDPSTRTRATDRKRRGPVT